jgi:hypothetical protein
MLSKLEHRHEPLASRQVFLRRMASYVALSAGIVLFSLGIGILGYHFLEGLSWIDSLLNASMILGGMGPVAPLETVAGKLFASFYALFSGMILLVAVGVLIAPAFHRFLHHFHFDIDEGNAAAEVEKTPKRSHLKRISH